MALMKWVLVFIFSFVISLVVIMTFSQSIFKQTVPGKIFGYTTEPIALYWFVLGAFVVGLFIGLIGALYVYITQVAKNVNKNRQIRDLEDQLSQKDQVSQTNPIVQEENQ